MDNYAKKLFYIKLIHTIIFIFVSTSIFYIFYCGATKTYNWILIPVIIIVLINGIVILFNKRKCPLTLMAKKYGGKDERFSEIFFPKQFAPIIVPFFTTLFIIGIILLITSKY